MEAGQTSVQAPQPTQDLPITGSFPMSLMAPSRGSTLQTSRQSSQSFPTWADNFSLSSFSNSVLSPWALIRSTFSLLTLGFCNLGSFYVP